MKAYIDKENVNLNQECSEVEFLCSREELELLIEELIKFRNKINNYVKQSSSSKLGITHMHTQDCIKTWTKEDTDLVIYIDLDK